MDNILQAIIYFLAAIVLLRIGGKRTISQMTTSEMVIMIGLGTVLVHPLKSESSWISVYNGTLIMGGLIIVSLLQIYVPKSKKWIMGEPITVIKDGEILRENLKKTRVPEDEFKMKLRIKKINDITKVKTATFEVSGELGVELYPDYTYATKKDIEDVKYAIKMLGQKMNTPMTFYTPPTDSNKNLFNQVKEVEHEDPLQ